MNKSRTIGFGNAARQVFGVAVAAALAGSVAIAYPAAAQSQPSSDLRTSMTANLAEHTLLAGNATAALLGNRTDEYQSASAALSQNSSRIAGLVGILYGGNANSTFLPLWQRHIQYYADYANALKASDQGARQQASANLTQWSVDVGTLLGSPAQFRSTDASGANQNQAAMSSSDMAGNAGTVTQMMQQHVMDTMKVIDAQSAGNWPQAYSLAAADVRHMKMVAQNLVNMQGNAPAYQVAGADLKANLAMLLVEKAALNANATSALINNRVSEYQAATSALNDNAEALSGAFNAVYGGTTYNNLNSLWNSQSLKLAQYANALTSQDVDTQEAARANVRGFTANLVTQFNNSNSQVPALTLNGWGGTLSTGAINLIDAQNANDFAREYQLRAQTNQRLLQLTDEFAQSIGQQFPNQYGLPAAPAIPANVGSMNDATGAGVASGTGGATTDTGTADVAGDATTSGDASTAGSTVLLPQTGAAIGSSLEQVTGTTTTTDTVGAGADVTGTTTTTDTTGAAITGTTTATSSVLLPQTGADLTSSAFQVTSTTTTTDTVGAGADVTGTTTTTDTGSVLLPQSGADLTQQQQATPATFVPIALMIAGAALIMSVVLMAFARRDYQQQKRD